VLPWEKKPAILGITVGKVQCGKNATLEGTRWFTSAEWIKGEKKKTEDVLPKTNKNVLEDLRDENANK